MTEGASSSSWHSARQGMLLYTCLMSNLPVYSAALDPAPPVAAAPAAGPVAAAPPAPPAAAAAAPPAAGQHGAEGC